MNQSLRWKRFMEWWNTNWWTLRFDDEITKDELLSIISKKIETLKRGEEKVK